MKRLTFLFGLIKAETFTDVPLQHESINKIEHFTGNEFVEQKQRLSGLVGRFFSIHQEPSELYKLLRHLTTFGTPEITL